MLNMIAAMSRDRVIGNGNKIPWHSKLDFAHFKKVTMGGILIMGRKTFESIGKPLPGRTSVIISRNKELKIPEVITKSSVEEALSVEMDNKERFIIGGAEIYAQTLNKAERLFLTIVEGKYTGDAFFPEIDPSQWLLTDEVTHLGADINPGLTIKTFRKVTQ